MNFIIMIYISAYLSYKSIVEYKTLAEFKIIFCLMSQNQNEFDSSHILLLISDKNVVILIKGIDSIDFCNQVNKNSHEDN
ncbi:hypothetical protein BpHYR1_050942 [Brachionus plicatilis]|uniref:Uncharacterized protein n=1 Tax=Brachionus plicatilis TaxID=10195 RepID=A0A3M7QTD7_BRAPC|nr:hypothetical protein BpHYR1_050942 [Brachionus plicatilis]